jgi:hypothetical protein
MPATEIPTTLPVTNLSASSLRTFIECPERWRRKYIDREYEAPSASMILGGSIGAAEAHAYQAQIDGERPPTEHVLDSYAQEWDERVEREEVEWEDDKPGEIKDTGVGLLKVYEQEIVPLAKPVAVEREIRMDFDGVEWGVLAYLDREDADGRIKDMKVKKRRLSPAEAHMDLQAGVYMLGRRAEGNPAPGFDFETVIRNKTPVADVISTTRLEDQLDALTSRIYDIAAEIHWRLESNVWAYAAPATRCCSYCGYHSCPLNPKR